MSTLEQKIIDFKVKFVLGGWLNENKNVCEVERWLKDNFSNEEIKPVETPIVEKVVELPIEDLNAPVDDLELPIAPVDEYIGSAGEVGEVGDDLVIDEVVELDIENEVLEPTPQVKKEGFLDRILN